MHHEENFRVKWLLIHMVLFLPDLFQLLFRTRVVELYFIKVMNVVILYKHNRWKYFLRARIRQMVRFIKTNLILEMKYNDITICMNDKII